MLMGKETILMEQAIKSIAFACEKRLAMLFTKGIPGDIEERYKREMEYLKESEYVDEFEKVFKESQINKGMICSKGTISGSFLYFLMTEKGYNPLKPYYYCETCGYYESIEQYQNCVDTPNKCCPECRNIIKAAGYNVSIESVWGLDGKKAIGFEKEDVLHPVVEKRLKQLLVEFKSESFEDKVKLSACASNAYSWENNEDEELDLERFKSFFSSEEFKACEFYTREELFEKLCEMRISFEKAFSISEFVRKGGIVRKSKEIQRFSIPAEIVLASNKICYLESRAHAIQTAYQYWIKNSH